MIQDNISHIIAPEQIDAARQLIQQYDRFVISAHMSPDGDAMGSALAFKRYLEKKGKQATVVMNDMPGDNLHFIPGISSEILIYDNQNNGKPCQRAAAEQAYAEAQVIVGVDFNTPRRMGDMAVLFEKSDARKLLIDHHLDPDTGLFDVVISYPQMCATCELVYRFILQMGDDALLDTHMAAQIYCGMMTDTGIFYYNSNRPEVYMIVARLLQEGFDKEAIHRATSSELERRVRLKGYVLHEKMRLFYPHRAAYISLNRAELKQFNHQKGDSEGFVNMPLDIRGIQVSVFFREEKNFVKVSLRSRGDYPVNEMAEKFFNGGGHKNAAGGEFFGSLQQAEQLFVKILPLFDKYLEN